MSFEQRWLIEGSLTTHTSLRIGNGDTTTREKLRQKDSEGRLAGEKIKISAFTTDAQGRAYLPGTSIKGRLRAWARANRIPKFEDLFGSEMIEKSRHLNAGGEDAKSKEVGGKAEFWDAFAIEAPASLQLPYWDASRLTAVTTAVSINRRTRTASEKRLFHQEYVPPGVGFNVTVSGDFNDEELDDLLFVLEGFNQPTRAVTLGASTGDGWGRVRWELTGIKRLQASEVAAWMQSGGAGYAALKELTPGQRRALAAKAQQRAVAAASRACVRLKVRLHFDSHFLVNDPSQTGTEEEGKPTHAPLLDRGGKVYLPASSIRGALRSQAEKILRTLGGDGAACYLDGRGLRKPCDPVDKVEELGELCPACQVFGAPGWRSPVEFSDFVPAQLLVLLPQEFVAVDRFTGGGAKGLKFNATAAYHPTLTGYVSLDLTALQRAVTGAWALGLLALTLRDLLEGDVRLGFGAAKGYGALRASVESVSVPEWSDCPRVFKRNIDEDLWQTLDAGGPLDDRLKIAMQDWVNAIQKRVEGEKQ
ncbi:MAG: RAMP superfamily CRISPR-associated protein [Acidobacteriota bacterium]